MATSPPATTRVGVKQVVYIMHPQGRSPQWNTITVSARKAVLADGLASAFYLMNRDEILRKHSVFQRCIDWLFGLSGR